MARIVPNKTMDKTPSVRTMKILADNWNKLRELSMALSREGILYAGYDVEDILLETFHFIVREIKRKNVDETLELFIKQYRTHLARAILNHHEEQTKLGIRRIEGEEQTKLGIRRIEGEEQTTDSVDYQNDS